MIYLNILLSASVTTFTIFLTVFQFANAAEVSKVKGTQLIIENEGQVFTEDQILTSMDGEIKVKIKKIKQDKSLAEIVEGTPTVGMKLTPKNSNDFLSKDETDSKPIDKSSSQKTDTRKQRSKKKPEQQRTGLKFILFVGTASQSMSVKGSDDVKYNLKGNNSFSELAVAYPLSQQLEVLGLLGSTPFKTKETTSDGVEHSTEISYTKFGGLVRYSFLPGDFKLWLGGGLNYLLANSKKSNVLNEDKIGAQQSISLSFGADFGLGQGMSIPLIGEYALIPPSSSVSTQEIRVFTGFSYQLD